MSPSRWGWEEWGAAFYAVLLGLGVLHALGL